MNRRNFIKSLFLGLCGAILASNSVNAGVFKPSKNKMDKLLQKHSLVVYKNLRISYYDGRGISPLMQYLENDDFSGAYVADKRIGKASALLLAYGNVKEVYTPVISKPAIEVFKKYNIDFFAVKIVDNILNRDLTDLCPMEKKVKNIDDPKEAYELFKAMNSEKK
ncbi:MAG: DUF1893 domain-containing protein [Candidatus Gastranaerophilaceae bacterium]